MAEKQHGVYFVDSDDARSTTAKCECGWTLGPFPDYKDAADAYGDHRGAEGMKVGTDSTLALFAKLASRSGEQPPPSPPGSGRLGGGTNGGGE